jgi:hypothetical protein
LACCGLGGDLGWVPRGSLQKDFEAACLAANENQLQSTKTSFGFHLFIVEAKKTHSMESPQQSAQVSEALRLLSHSIVSRTVPEAHPVWAVPSKETKRKRGPSRNDPPKNNKNEEETKVTGVLTEKELDQLFVRWKNVSRNKNILIIGFIAALEQGSQSLDSCTFGTRIQFGYATSLPLALLYWCVEPSEGPRRKGSRIFVFVLSTTFREQGRD